jgi:hypothetical protein
MKTLVISIFATGVGVIALGQWRIEKVIRDHQETIYQHQTMSAPRSAEPVKPVPPAADDSKRIVNALDSLRFYFMQQHAQEKNSETMAKMLEAQKELEYLERAKASAEDIKRAEADLNESRERYKHGIYMLMRIPSPADAGGEPFRHPDPNRAAEDALKQLMH